MTEQEHDKVKKIAEIQVAHDLVLRNRKGDAELIEIRRLLDLWLEREDRNLIDNI